MTNSLAIAETSDLPRSMYAVHLFLNNFSLLPALLLQCGAAALLHSSGRQLVWPFIWEAKAPAAAPSKQFWPQVIVSSSSLFQSYSPEGQCTVHNAAVLEANLRTCTNHWQHWFLRLTSMSQGRVVQGADSQMP